MFSCKRAFHPITYLWSKSFLRFREGEYSLQNTTFTRWIVFTRSTDLFDRCLLDRSAREEDGADGVVSSVDEDFVNQE